MVRCSGLVLISMVVVTLGNAAEAVPVTGTGKPDAPKVEAKAAHRAPFHLLVDYLSPALYEGEPFTACLRVENTTGQEVDVDVLAEVLGAGEKVLKTEHRPLNITAGGQASCRFDVGLAEVRSVRFSCHAPWGVLRGPCVVAVRSNEAWPAVKVVDGLLAEAESGRVLLPVVARSERKEVHRFAPLGGLLSGARTAREEPRSAFIFVPGEWTDVGLVDFSGELIPEKVVEGKTWAKLGPYPLQGVAPVLLAVGACARLLPEPVPERVIVVLPAGDLDAATDPRLFRIAVEVLVARLELAGVEDVVISCPLLYGVSVEQVELLARAAKEALVGRSARLLDRRGLMDESLWRLDAKTPGVYGRQPNAAGRKMIRQALTDLIP